jgi:hypothetical protein
LLGLATRFAAMLWRTPLAFAVREKGNVFFRTAVGAVTARAAQTPLLRERPHPLAEVVRRMVRVRVRYEQSADEKERVLLRGEYKFFTGKAVHMRDASVTDLVAAVSCAGFFGFWDTAMLDEALELLFARADELSAVELCQLAQDLPRVDRARSPLMRSVFRLLCRGNAERLRSDLSLEDHLDLLRDAVGTHCPRVFVDAVVDCVVPFLGGGGAQPLTVPALLALVQAMALQQRIDAGQGATDGAEATGAGASVDDAALLARRQAAVFRRVRGQLLVALRTGDDIATVDAHAALPFNSARAEARAAAEPASADVGRLACALAELGALDVRTARAVRAWLSDAGRAAKLPCAVCVDLCRHQAALSLAPGGSNGHDDQDLEETVALVVERVTDSVSALEPDGVARVLELVAAVAAAPGASALGSSDPLHALLCATLSHVVDMREAGAGVWPTALVLHMLWSLAEIADRARAAPAVAMPPAFGTAVKSVCAALIHDAPLMSAPECCAFFAVAERLGPAVLDASVTAVARRAAAAVAEMASSDVADLLAVIEPTPGAVAAPETHAHARRTARNPIVVSALLPALRAARLQAEYAT